jgi:photosystem II stability/assembly factor-like uncharacterized protein
VLIAMLFAAPALAEEGREETGPRFSPPDEMLMRASATVERARVGEAFAARRAGPEGLAPPLDWTALGPHPITSEYWSGAQAASGRVNSIAVDPRDGDVAYAAAALGGVWKTTDGGLSWTPMTDGLSSIASGCVVLDPSNPDVVWYGTGEQNFAIDSFYGDGLFKSPDGGLTWSKVAGTVDVGSYISRVVVDRTSSLKLLVASEHGVVRSIDGGLTWDGTLLDGWATDLVQSPDDPLVFYAAVLYNGVYRSTNGGATWDPLVGGGLPTSGFFRVNLAIASSNGQVLLAGFSRSFDQKLLGLFRSVNGGASWSQLVATPDYLAGQGFYNQALAIDPANPDIAFAGGVFPYDINRHGIVRTLTGGAAWTDVTIGTSGQVHPDIHAFTFGPDGRLWVGSDGGVWRTSDHGETWTNCNTDLDITQFYTLAVQPGGTRILGGTQDNGNLQYTGLPGWSQTTSGDGGPTDFNRSNTSLIYVSYVVMNPLWRGSVFSTSFSDITGPWEMSDRVDWANAGFAVDANATTTLLVGSQRVWRTTNEGNNWTAVSGDLTGGSGRIRSLAVAHGAGSTVAATTSDGHVQWTTDLANWTHRDVGLPAAQIPAIAMNPADPNDLVVVADLASGARVFTSNDAGVNWTNATGDLPTGPRAMSLAVDFRCTPHALHVGTDMGVYASADGGMHWEKHGASLPNAAVYGIAVDLSRDEVVAATHGRGMWRAPAAALRRARLASVSPPFRRQGDAALGLTVTGAGFRPGAVVRVDGADRPTGYVNAARLTATLDPGDLASPGVREITVMNGGATPLESAAAPFTVLPPDSACCLYTDSNEERTDAGAGATGAAFADFDLDARPDLALARLDAGEVALLRAAADGRYEPAASLAVPGARDVAAADFDGDGRPDLAIAQPAQNRVIVAYAGPGFSFWGFDTVSAGTAPSRLAVGDLDNDGRPDLVVGQTAAYVVRLLNDGAGAFPAILAWRRTDLAKVPFNSPVGVALADVDRDGYLDVIGANRNTTTVGVVSGISTSFPYRNYITGAGGVVAAAGFFNADSLPDFAVAHTGDSTISLFRNTGGANFTRTVLAARRLPLDLEAADVDGDGACDLVAACAGARTLAVFLGNNDGTFDPPIEFDLGARAAALALRPDLRLAVVADSLGALALLELDRGLAPRVFATGLAPRDVASADLDADSKPDLVSANGDGTVSVLYGRGDGTFERHVDLAAGGAARAVAIGDLDTDGKPDLAAARADGQVSLWRNLGARALAAQTPVPCDPDARDLRIADVDGAGGPDLVLASGASAQVLLRSGGFAFTPGATLPAPPGETFHAVEVADLAGDLEPDLVLAADSSVLVFNRSGGGFDPTPLTYAGGPASGALALGDVTGDALPDLVHARHGTLVVRPGLAGGAFGAAATRGAGLGSPADLRLSDVTGDGALDAVLADPAGGRLLVLAGNGIGAFGPSYAYRAGRGAGAVAIADLDGDTDLDAVVANLTDATVSVHEKAVPGGPLAVEPPRATPRARISAVWPDPARALQNVRFSIPSRAEVDLGVYDVAGRSVASLARGTFAAGEHAAEWTGRTASGEPCAPGVYFLRLRAGGEEAVRRIVRLR